jgi:nitroreductase
VARALACQFWAPNHKLKGSWRFLQLGPESRLRAARLSAGAESKAEARYQALSHIPGCFAVVCKAYYEAPNDRVEKEEQRALLAVHNVALALTSQGLGVKWVTGSITENYELWELIGLEPNEEVMVGLLWYGWPDATKPIKDQTSVSDKLSRLP